MRTHDLICKIIFITVVLFGLIGCQDSEPSATKQPEGRIDYTDQFDRISIQGHDYLSKRSGHSRVFIHEPECKKCAEQAKTPK